MFAMAVGPAGTLLGLLPVMLGGSPEQHRQFLSPFLESSGAPLAALCNSEPGGGVFGTTLMRAAFEFALDFAKT